MRALYTNSNIHKYIHPHPHPHPYLNFHSQLNTLFVKLAFFCLSYRFVFYFKYTCKKLIKLYFCLESMAENKQKNTRKVTKTWSKDEVRTLINELESRPDLWDPSRQNYSNR